MRRQSDLPWKIISGISLIISCGAIFIAALVYTSLDETDIHACEATNALRANQASGLQDQINQTYRSLQGDLGALEPFRKQIRESNDKQVKSLERLAKTANPPKKDDKYQVECKEK